MREWKKILFNKHLLKVYALFTGYGLWFFFSQSQMVDVVCSVPLCFYGNSTNMHIQAPAHIDITLRMQRSHLQAFNSNSISAYIDAATLQEGTNIIALTNHDLALPETIALVSHEPTPLSIVMQHQEKVA